MKDADIFQQALGSVIRRMRCDMALTQEQLAQKAELHRTYLSNVERGERNVTLGCTRKIAKALNVPLEKLIHQAEALL